MKFTVVWTPSSARELTEIWLASTARHLIASATDQLDELLSRDLQSIGESRHAGVRIVFVFPLAVEFEVDIPERKVFVRAVWDYHRV